MKRLCQLLFIFLAFDGSAFTSEIDVPYPAEKHPWGIQASNSSLQEYANSIIKKHFIQPCTDDSSESYTLNQMGTVMQKAKGHYAAAFLEFSQESPHPVLSVGEGTGNIARAALHKGITFIANDMDPRHLGILAFKTPLQYQKHLYLKAGKFPDQTDLPYESIKAVYYGRVLHFLTGEEIERSLQKTFEILVPGGKIYARASSPYQRHLQFFQDEYSKRISAGDKWPGICTEMEKGWPTLHQYLPNFVHLLDKVPLKRALESSGFAIEELEYTPINSEQFTLDGREGIGFIARKPG